MCWAAKAGWLTVTVAARVVSTQGQPSLTVSRLASIGLVVGESSCARAPPLPNPSHTARILPPTAALATFAIPSLLPHPPIASSSFGSAFKSRLLPVVLAFVVALRLSPANMRAATTTQHTTNTSSATTTTTTTTSSKPTIAAVSPLHVTSCSELVGVVVVATTAGGGGIGARKAAGLAGGRVRAGGKVLRECATRGASEGGGGGGRGAAGMGRTEVMVGGERWDKGGMRKGGGGGGVGWSLRRGGCRRVIGQLAPWCNGQHSGV